MMKNKLRVVKTINEAEKPAKAQISDKEFRRSLKEIDEWRKKRLAETRSENSHWSLYSNPLRNRLPWTLRWVTEKLTRLRGGCSVIENVAGYYLSINDETIDDRVNIVFSDFPMNRENLSEREEVLDYCSGLQKFLLENLWEEAILITAYPIYHSSL